jgi:DNA mismatch repair protein MutL
VALKLVNNGRVLFQSNGQNNLQSVIAAIYGFDIAKQMKPFKAESDDFKISGYLSDPVINRASRNYVTLIVNGRAIRNYPLTRAILEAYHTFLPKDRYPIVVLNIELDPILVDVNVHPAKLEVRFSKEETLRAFIHSELRQALSKVEYIPETQIKTPIPKPAYEVQSLPLGSGNSYQPAPEATSYSVGEPESIREQKPVLQETQKVKYPVPGKNPGANTSLPLSNPKAPAAESIIAETPLLEQVPRPAASQPTELKITAPAKETAGGLELYYIGQLHGTYLLAQNEEGLFIIDQHAAMERVHYEKNYQLLGAAKSDCTELLIPLVLKYPANELLLVKETLPDLMEFGFEVEEFGGQSLVVRTIPVWAQGEDAKTIIETLIGQIMKDRKTDLAKLREAVAITMSCKGSIKANQYINEYEIKELLARLCGCEQPYTCPHGRPIIVKLTKYEVEKLFKRVQ